MPRQHSNIVENDTLATTSSRKRGRKELTELATDSSIEATFSNRKRRRKEMTELATEKATSLATDPPGNSLGNTGFSKLANGIGMASQRLDKNMKNIRNRSRVHRDMKQTEIGFDKDGKFSLLRKSPPKLS